MPVDMWRNTWRDRVRFDPKPRAVETKLARHLLDRVDHRDEKLRIDKLRGHQRLDVLLRNDDRVDRRLCVRMMERDHALVLVDHIDVELPAQNILAVPVALAPTIVMERPKSVGHARGARWQRGQWNVPRPPTTVRTIARPQRGHGSPARE